MSEIKEIETFPFLPGDAGEDDDDIEYDDFEEDDDDEIIRAKWTFDGATTLSEAAEKLRAYADWLIEQENLGWQLTQPIEDDYGFIRQHNEDAEENDSEATTLSEMQK